MNIQRKEHEPMSRHSDEESTSGAKLPGFWPLGMARGIAKALVIAAILWGFPWLQFAGFFWPSRTQAEMPRDVAYLHDPLSWAGVKEYSPFILAVVTVGVVEVLYQRRLRRAKALAKAERETECRKTDFAASTPPRERGRTVPIVGEDWLRLARKTRRMPLLTYEPRMTTRGGVLEMRSGRGFTTFGVIIIVFALGFAGFLFASGGKNAKEADSDEPIGSRGVAIVCAFSGLMTLIGVIMLLNGRKLQVEEEGDDVVIWTGIRPFVSQCRFDRTALSVRLSAAETGYQLQADQMRGPGTLLSLVHAGSDQVVHLASGTRERLQSAYDALSRLFARRAADLTLIQVPITGGVAVVIPRTPLATSSTSFRTAHLKVVSSEVAVFRPTLHAVSSKLFGMALGLAFAGFAIAMMASSGTASLSDRVFPIVFVVVGLGIVIAEIWLFLRHATGRRITRDATGRTVDVRTGRNAAKNLTCLLRDVVGIQICSRYVSGSECSGYTAYELNIAFAGGEPQRINLLSHADERGIRKDAELLAEFLGKPVFDHTEPRA
jgi:hypothetical protein